VGDAGDQAANAVGVGVVEVGTMALSLGTSGVVFAPTDSPLFEPRSRYRVPNPPLPIDSDNPPMLAKPPLSTTPDMTQASITDRTPADSGAKGIGPARR
jgi:hypothetical protein